jgi:group II intron reverse transcriptase/maturase
LYDKTYRLDFLTEAYRRVKANGGKPGVDGETFEAIEGFGVDDYLKELQLELKEKRYRPSSVLRVYIPKPNGDKRPLGIPTIRDRIVQASFKLVLEPIFEADFSDRSFGFRPKKSAHDAVREIAKLLNWGCTEVYDVDLAKYFDTVDHGKLMLLVARRIVDRMILKTIKSWLQCGYVEDGQHRTPKRGTPQGGVISPLLANIYLNPMDKAMVRSKLWWRDRGSVHLVRYADDFLLLAHHNLELGKRIVKDTLNRLGLEINETKSREYSIGSSGPVDFLGFRFARTDNRKNGGKFTWVMPSPISVKRVRDKLRKCINYFNPVPIEEQIARSNVLMRGWTNYFGIGNASHTFNKLRSFINRRVRRILQRRHFRRGYGYRWFDSNYIYGRLGLLYKYKTCPLG